MVGCDLCTKGKAFRSSERGIYESAGMGGLEEDEENGANMIEDFLSSTDINAEEMIGWAQ